MNNLEQSITKIKKDNRNDPLNGNPFHAEINGFYDQWFNMKVQSKY